jgi:hypothetical protein
MAIRLSQCYKRTFELTVDAASVAAVTVSNQTFSTGTETVSVEDMVVVNPASALSTGVALVGGFVSAANTLTLTFVNPTAAPVDPASVVIKVNVL